MTPATDSIGRPLTCRFCGSAIAPHAHAGRPRKMCRRRACFEASEKTRRQKLNIRAPRCADCLEQLSVPHRRLCSTRTIGAMP